MALANSLNLSSTNPLPVTQGGSQIATATAYTPICAGITATAPFQSADVGFATAGTVLTSNGAAALPSWQAAGGMSLLFLVHLAANTAAVTGDGTFYTILYDTADVNIGACYNTGTGIFTVPTTGRYTFQAGVAPDQLGAAHVTMNWQCYNATAGTYASFMYLNPQSLLITGGYKLSSNTSFPAALTAGDAITSFCGIGGGAASVRINGAANSLTFWAGYKL